MATREKNSLVLIIFMLCGIVIGGLLGQFAQGVSWLSWLSFGKAFGFSTPFTLDLGVLQLTLGLMININIASIVGIIIAIFIYRKI